MIWNALRRRDPVHRHTTAGGRVYWSVTRYADAARVLRDPATFTTERGVLLDGLGVDDPAGGRQIAVTDPPRHRLLRDPLHHALALGSPVTIDQMVRRHAHVVVAAWPDGEPFDLAAELALYPAAILGALMGLPASDWPHIAALTTAAVVADGEHRLPDGSRVTRRTAPLALYSYLQQALHQRRRQGGEDLITVLMRVEIEGHRLAPADVVSNCYNMLLGANVTMPHAVAATLLHLIGNDTYRGLAGDLRWASSGIEEVLRWSSPANHFLRHATRDVRIGRATIPEGDPVAVWLASANRDEDAFPRPYAFDIGRRPNKHLALGVGPHYCVGQAIARAGLQVLLEEIFGHVESFELAGEVEHLRSNLVAGFRRLPVIVRRRPRARVSSPPASHRGASTEEPSFGAPHCRAGPARRSGATDPRDRMTVDSRPWLPYRSANPEARLRLFCFPHAGGGASAYRRWQDAFSPDVDLCAVQLPGREARYPEPAATSMPGLVRSLVDGLAPVLDRPFALFGHSFGALIAYELCHELRSMGLPAPEHLFVSARRAPHLPSRLPPIHQLPDEAFAAELRRLEGTPEAVLANDALMALFVPITRADYTVCETYRWTERPPLDGPLTVLGGRDDPETTLAELEGWRGHTLGAVRVELFDGGHFFVHQARTCVQAVIHRQLTGPAAGRA